MHIENQIADYTAEVETLASIVNRRRAFISTAAMKETDNTRDKAIGVISRITGVYIDSPIAEKSSAARLVNLHISPYKGIGRHEYTKQTAEVKGMLSVLDKSEIKSALAVLGLTAETEALRKANAAFEEAFLGKTVEVGSRTTQSDIKSVDVLEKISALYSGIVQTVNAYAIVQPSDEIKKFVTSMNGLIGAY